jgi:hypothetical protein
MQYAGQDTYGNTAPTIEYCVKRGNSMLMNGDLGESLFTTWNNKQRRDEIAKLVDGFRAGLPIGILCKMAEAIAGSRKQARKHLHRLLTAEERQAAVAKETGGMQILVKDFLL